MCGDRLEKVPNFSRDCRCSCPCCPAQTYTGCRSRAATPRGAGARRPKLGGPCHSPDRHGPLPASRARTGCPSRTAVAATGQPRRAFRSGLGPEKPQAALMTAGGCPRAGTASSHGHGARMGAAVPGTAGTAVTAGLGVSLGARLPGIGGGRVRGRSWVHEGPGSARTRTHLHTSSSPRRSSQAAARPSRSEPAAARSPRAPPGRRPAVPLSQPAPAARSCLPVTAVRGSCRSLVVIRRRVRCTGALVGPRNSEHGARHFIEAVDSYRMMRSLSG